MANEADTCRKFVVPKLQAVGWDTKPHSIAEQREFTCGRIVVRGGKTQRRKSPTTAQSLGALLKSARDIRLRLGFSGQVMFPTLPMT
jgi:hypothetical protein